MKEYMGWLIDPEDTFEQHNPLREDAKRFAGLTLRGKPCVLIDNTGANLPEAELLLILRTLIDAQQFGFKPRSSVGGNALAIDRRESTHIQIKDQLYRLVIYRFEARIENF